MSVRDLADVVDVGIDVLGTDITASGATQNTISAQTGDSTSAQVSSANCEWWQHVGFASRPPKAIPGQPACQAVTINRGDRDICIATADKRSQAIYGNLKEGESCMYAAGIDGNAQGRVICKQSGAVALVTTDSNTASGHTMYLKLDPVKGFEMSLPWGRMTFGPNGFHVLHSGGARIDLGAIAGLPGPLAALGSYVKIEGGIASVKGGAVSLGTDGGAGNAAAVVLLTSLLTAINTLAAAIAAVPAAIGVAPSASPAVATALAAVVTANTAYAATASAIGAIV